MKGFWHWLIIDVLGYVPRHFMKLSGADLFFLIGTIFLATGLAAFITGLYLDALILVPGGFLFAARAYYLEHIVRREKARV